MGVFDGLHLGHLSLLERAGQAARERGAPLWVLTFWPHPDVVLGRREDARGFLLTPLADKVELLRQAGADRVLVLEFTREAAAVPAEEFFSRIRAAVAPRALAVGFNFGFGRGGEGNPALLGALGRRTGVETLVHPAVRLGREVVSSSAIRAALGRGDVERAGLLLGRPYSLAGRVERGAGRGRSLGFPTANVAFPAEAVRPAAGVYVASVLPDAGAVLRPGGAAPAVANLGSRPTFSGSGEPAELALEVHTLAGEPPTYGDEVRVFFLKRLREERAFPGPGALAERIARDRRLALEYFGLA